MVSRGITADISGTTIWRWLSEDSIKPWRVRSWNFPRDLDFEAKAGCVLDLYAREWEGQPLSEGDYVVSADEKTSIQARIRCHRSLPAAPGRAPRTEFEPPRAGPPACHASWINQAEIYFSVIQRKVLTPSGFSSLAQVQGRLLAFERRYEQAAVPFEWKLTRHGLALLMKQLARYQAAA